MKEREWEYTSLEVQDLNIHRDSASSLGIKEHGYSILGECFHGVDIDVLSIASWCSNFEFKIFNFSIFKFSIFKTTNEFSISKFHNNLLLPEFFLLFYF